MIQSENRNGCRLNPFEEIAGILEDLAENKEVLHAKIGPAVVALPRQIERTLRPLMGRRLAILRTDIPGREYLVHVLCEEIEDHDMESAAIAVQAAATESNTPSANRREFNDEFYCHQFKH